MTEGLLRDIDLRRELDIPRSTFYHLKARGTFDHLKTTRPAGTRIYSPDLVRVYLAGRSTVQLGRKTA